MISYLKNNWRDICSELAGLVIIIVLLFTVHYLTTAQARAKTGSAPNIGNFAAGTFTCSTQNGPIPAVRLDGKWQGKEDAYFVIATPRPWIPPDASSLLIRVNGKPVNDQSRPAMANVAQIPAWDGVPGHEPLLDITVSNPVPEHPFWFMMQWASSTGLGLLATARAMDTDCVLTNNPPR